MSAQIRILGAGEALRGGIEAALADVAVPQSISRLTITLCQFDDAEAQTQAQEDCDAGGTHHLPVLWTASGFWLGPLVAPGQGGCARCLILWQHQPHLPRDLHARDLRLEAQVGAVRLPLLRVMLAGQVARMIGDHAPGDAEAVRIHGCPVGVSAHHVLPHPRCPRCTPARMAQAPVVAMDGFVPFTGMRRPNPGIALDALRKRYVDGETGLIKRRGLIDSGLYPLSGASFLQNRMTGEMQSGFGRTGARKDSEKVAILEALERFAGTQRLGGSPVLVAPFGTDPRMVDPAAFILHDPVQRDEPGFTLAPHDPAMPMAWLPARNLTHGSDVLVPEQLVYYGASDAGRSGPRSIYEISNGCSLGSSLEDAAFYGLCEVVERDAFLCHWYTGKTPREIDLDTIPDPELPLIRERVEGEGFVLRAFDMSTMDSIRAIMVAMTDPASDTPFAAICASGAHRDPLAAFKGALVEAVSTFTSSLRPGFATARPRALAMLADPGAVQAMDDHLLLYSAPQAQERLAFLLHARPAIPFAALGCPAPVNASQALAEAVGELAELGHEVLVADQSFDLLAPSGLAAVKVLVPGLLPMTFGHQYRRISHRRLAAFRGQESFVFNPHPHNFP